jgi:purine-cytosine permease-like protein
VGPIATDLGGADISWIVGFIVAAVLYYLAARRRQPTARTRETAPSASR